MLGKDKGNRKRAGASAGIAPVGEESPCQGWALCPAILQRIHPPLPCDLKIDRTRPGSTPQQRVTSTETMPTPLPQDPGPPTTRSLQCPDAVRSEDSICARVSLDTPTSPHPCQKKKKISWRSSRGTPMLQIRTQA